MDNLLGRSNLNDPFNPAGDIRSNAAFAPARKLILERQLANKRRRDANSTRTTSNVGDIVILEIRTKKRLQDKKLTYTYVGPYKITRKLSHLSFEIVPPKGNSRPAVVHPCSLKEFILGDDVAEDEFVEPNFIPSETPGEQPATGPDSDTDDASETSNDGISSICGDDILAIEANHDEINKIIIYIYYLPPTSFEQELTR